MISGRQGWKFTTSIRNCTKKWNTKIDENVKNDSTTIFTRNPRKDIAEAWGNRQLKE